MKICYIAPATPGPEHTQRWIRYFADAGHEVHLIISSDKLSLVGFEKINIHLLKRFGPHTRTVNYIINSIPLVIQFNRLIKSINPDIIHVHQISDLALLGLINRFHPLVVTPWGSDVLIAPKKSKISRYIVKNVLKKADLITCDAEHIKKPLIELGADPGKIRLIYFGIDTQKFNPGQKDIQIRKELGIPGAPIIISSRRLDSDCDVESLITAIPLVLKEFPEVIFVIAGVGSQAVKLKELAKSLGVSESVKFAGWIPNDELPNYLTSADIFVSTSLSDAGLAASTAEAMACGLPVIITDFGDNRKWVEDGVNGFIVPMRDPHALASRIVYLLQNENERKKFGHVCRQIIEERNNWEKEMKKMGTLYEELIEHKNEDRM